MDIDTKSKDVVTRDVLREELGTFKKDIDSQFDEFGKRVDEQFNQFGFKLFRYLDRRFDEVNARIDGLDERYDKLMTTLDAFLKRLDDIEADNHARDAQIARLERWIETIAQKTGVKLEY